MLRCPTYSNWKDTNIALGCICILYSRAGKFKKKRRKRRRQQWHARRALEAKSKTKKGKLIKKKKKTKDQGKFERPLKEIRRCPTLKQKLVVVDYALELQAKKHRAKEAYLEPRPFPATREQIARHREKRAAAKQDMKIGVQKECMKKYGEILGKAQICKWVKVAEAEGWKQLPDSILGRAVTTPNSWRTKLGLPLRGRKDCGQVPLCLQKELDLLMVEASSGLSDVAERKEIVTAEQVDSCLQELVWVLIPFITAVFIYTVYTYIYTYAYIHSSTYCNGQNPWLVETNSLICNLCKCYQQHYWKRHKVPC